MMDDATRAQTDAADPGTSTWLSANAGSGKTRVLTDRVARLLLDGVRPERILCLTYTKAAAMEMQNRLFSRLGAWAMTSDEDLRDTLGSIGVPEDRLSSGLLGDARTLFARAIEAPGGLKIQTIHSFCASVLRRFPLEAGVSPAFVEIDDRVQSRLIADLLDDLADTPSGRNALSLVAAHLSDDGTLQNLARAVAGEREVLATPLQWNAIAASFEIDPALSEADIIDHALRGDEADLARTICAHLEPDKKTHVAMGQKLSALDWDRPSLDTVTALEASFVFQSGQKRGEPRIDGIANASVRAAIGAAMAPINELAERLAEARVLRLGLLNARRTNALHRFAEVFLPAYSAAKDARGWLDFDDLILGMNRLLSDQTVAQWVLFRLDGGIDHILVDEAQDTSPRQWRIVEQLTEDFAAGQGARSDVVRTIFVVGDKKQSIYSFQGADPGEFDRMRAHFRDRLDKINAPFQPDARLLHSFRSAPPILALVDAVAADLGAPGLGGEVEHRAFKSEKAGRVDLWPHIKPTEAGEDTAWDDPKDLVSEDHHTAVLAKALGDRIRHMLDEPPLIDGRPVTAGDILILVRSRGLLFHKIIAELKLRDVPVAGVDRSKLTAPLAVQDLLALCRFVATPEDDLSLAAALRSPLLGMSEAALYDLATGRESFLWEALRKKANVYPEAHAILKDLRDQADFLRPYEMMERVLIRHDGRRRLIARLGAEAEDAIDAILAQALTYEASEVPSLTGFIGWLDSGEVEVKRDLSKAAGEVRVMTVHGAKGLEAPVVILPDCAASKGGGNSIKLLTPEGGPLSWVPGSAEQTDPLFAADAARAERDMEEANRLLYVALTRAESWLIVAAAGGLGDQKKPASSWYKIVRAAMDGMGAAPLSIDGLDGDGLRLESGAWAYAPAAPDKITATEPLPDWAERTAPKPQRDVPALTPSGLGGAKALPGAGDETAIALKRGRFVHLLLEHLPRLPQAAWPAAAPGIAALDGPPGGLDLDPLLNEATAVLTAPHLATIFAPDTLAEVEITGRSDLLGHEMLGIIDRLVVTETDVLAVDFKTNRSVPATAADVPEGLLRQMGAYAEMLKPIYPNRKIRTALLWSVTAELMELPHDLVSDALSRARDA